MIPPAPHNNTVLVVRRVFTVPRQQVFRAWIEPHALERWLRPRGLSMTVSKLEAHVDGSFRFDLENGSSIFGTYLNFTPPEKLVFTWCGEAIQDRETIVTLDFLDKGSMTEVVLTHERLDTPELLAIFSSGWSPMFDTLAEILTSHPNF